jgi:hypothetical protein
MVVLAKVARNNAMWSHHLGRYVGGGEGKTPAE